MVKSKAVLIAISIIAVVVALSLILWHQLLGNKLQYPESLPDGSQVARIISGEDAVRTMRMIHWRPGAVDVEEALIVVYTSGARLWISKASNACMEVEFMAKKMAIYESMLPYTTPSRHNLGGTVVYVCFDKRNGWINAFWCKGDLVVWAELPPSEAKYLELLVKNIT